MWERAISILERLWVLFRPKTHNVIARIVILVGIALATEAQFSFFELIIVFLIESISGPSELLRKIFEGDSTPWIGVALIAFGLVYHLAITLGLEYFGTPKALEQKEPDLELTIQNLDGETLEHSSTLRGKLCDVPQKKDIPDFSPTVRPSLMGTNSISDLFNQDSPNWAFYREQATLLREWGGADVFSLSLENKGEILGKNIRVELTVAKKRGVIIENENDPEPDAPSRYNNRYASMDSLLPHQPDRYDILSSDRNEYLFFEWDVGTLQAKASRTSRTSLIIRTRHEIVLKFAVFSDEFSAPKKYEFVVRPPAETLQLSVSDITADDDCFDQLANEAIMDGYLTRQVDRLIEKMEDD